MWQKNGTISDILKVKTKMDKKINCFAPCPRGLEELLAQEIETLGGTDTEVTGGGVSFRADWTSVYKINLHSRLAIRVLWQLARGKVSEEHDVYLLAKQIPWHTLFSVDKTIKVKVEARKSKFQSLDYIALTIKDAVCDEFRQAMTERPSVDKAQPDIRIQGFLSAQEAFIFIDTSGEALFKRGYRQDKGEAPLRENLAAGLLLLAGYDGSQPLLDPMCGSGTIAIEAALMAQNRAVGLYRNFAFEKLIQFNSGVWKKLKQEALAAQNNRKLSICASDNDRYLLADAQKNAQSAKVAEFIDFSVCDITETRPQSAGGLMLTNPPYGVRLEDEERLAALYPQLGTWLKQNFSGWTACFFSGDMRLPKLMRLSPKRKWPLYNGAIDCRLFVIPMVAGTNRK